MQQIKLTLGCILLAIFLAGAMPAKADSVPDDVEFALLKKFYDSLGGSAWTKKDQLAGYRKLACYRYQRAVCYVVWHYRCKRRYHADHHGQQQAYR